MQIAEVLIHFRKHKHILYTLTLFTNTHYAVRCEGVIIYAAVFLSSTVQRAERPDSRSTSILALRHIFPHRERGTDLLSPYWLLIVILKVNPFTGCHLKYIKQLRDVVCQNQNSWIVFLCVAGRRFNYWCCCIRGETNGSTFLQTFLQVHTNSVA